MNNGAPMPMNRANCSKGCIHKASHKQAEIEISMLQLTESILIGSWDIWSLPYKGQTPSFTRQHPKGSFKDSWFSSKHPKTFPTRRAFADKFGNRNDFWGSLSDGKWGAHLSGVSVSQIPSSNDDEFIKRTATSRLYFVYSLWFTNLSPINLMTICSRNLHTKHWAFPKDLTRFHTLKHERLNRLSAINTILRLKLSLGYCIPLYPRHRLLFIAHNIFTRKPSKRLQLPKNVYKSAPLRAQN